MWNITRGRRISFGENAGNVSGVDDCLNICLQISTCVAVDIEHIGSEFVCYTHVNISDFSNGFIGVSNFDNYRLVTRCAGVSTSTTTPSGTSILVALSNYMSNCRRNKKPPIVGLGKPHSAQTFLSHFNAN